VQLFDFDLEVQPILEVVVGKTAEQALAEVAQEEELAALREHQRRYAELRDAERAERRRLEAQDLRLHHEKVSSPRRSLFLLTTCTCSLMLLLCRAHRYYPNPC
jgi:hypothetical protein